MLKTWKPRTWGITIREGLLMGGEEDSTGVRMMKATCSACRITMGMGQDRSHLWGGTREEEGMMRGGSETILIMEEADKE